MQGSTRKRGDKWYYSFDLGMINGKRKRIERVGGKTKKEAEKKLREALATYENSGSVFEASKVSFADYLDYWLKNYAELEYKHNTIQNYKQIIKNHLKPALGDYKLKSLTPSVLQEFINKKSLSGYSKNHLTGILNVLKVSIRCAVQPFQFIKESPMLYVKLPKIARTKSENNRVLEPEEINKILERFPEGSTFYIPIMIAYHTGLRVGEVCSLTWDDIDFNNATLSVSKTLVKKGRQWTFGSPKTFTSIRTIAIGETLIKALNKQKKHQSDNIKEYAEYYTHYSLKGDAIIESKSPGLSFVCTRENGEFVTIDTIKYLSRVINYGLGITFSFHNFRHTHATRLLENDANIKDVQERLGHATSATTADTYAHATSKMTRRTIDIFEKVANEKI